MHGSELVDDVVRVPEEGVGEAGLQEVHRQEGRVLDNQVQQDVDRLSVPDALLVVLLGKPQQAGRGKGQELFQPAEKINQSFVISEQFCRRSCQMASK